MHPLRLDEETHRYFVGEDEYEAVSKILEALELSHRFSNLDAFYSIRGRAVHSAVEMVDKSSLDRDSLDPIIRPYVDAYLLFLRQSGYTPVETEFGMYDAEFRFAGTVDKIGMLNGRLGILDVKTGQIDPAVDLQLSAYAYLWNKYHPDRKAEWRYALQLREDGTYNLVTKYSKTDTLIWEAVMVKFRGKPEDRIAWADQRIATWKMRNHRIYS